MTTKPTSFPPSAHAHRLRAAALSAMLLGLAACAAPAPQVDQAALQAAVQAQESNLAGAEADIATRRFQLAFQRLARLDKATAETPRARYALAEVLLGLGRPHEALTRFEAVQADPAFQTLAMQGIGLTHLALGDTAGAIAELDRAVTADPGLWRAWAGLGRAYDQEQRWSEADAAYASGLAANPDSAIIYNNQGMSLLLQHRYADAAGAFERAIAKDPALETARTNLRIVLAWQGRYEEALAGLHPSERADALNNIGYVAMLRGDRPAAQRYFAQAMEASPTFHQSAAVNLETLKLLAKSHAPAALPQAADVPTP